MTQAIKDLLTRADILALVDNNQWDEFYEAVNSELSYHEMKELNDFLHEEININPLDFMTQVPTAYFTEGTYKTIKIPDQIETISDCAFTGSTITNLYLPRNLKSISESSFYNCRVETVHLPYSTTDYMKSVTIDTFGCAYNRSFKLADPDGVVTELIVPTGITNNFSNHFQNCRSLKKIKFEEGVDNIAPYTFSQCCEVSEIELPHSMEVIGKGAFGYCPSLTTIRYNGTCKEFYEIIFAPCWLTNEYDNSTMEYTLFCTDGTYDSESMKILS